MTLAYSLVVLSHKHKGCLKNRGNKMTTVLVQIIAGALLLNTPIIIMWVLEARKTSKPKFKAENYAVEDFWATN